jgi:hypothetical protein
MPSPSPRRPKSSCPSGRNGVAVGDETQQEVLGPDVVVVQETCFLLGEDDNTTSFIGEQLEHTTSVRLLVVQLTARARSSLAPEPERHEEP